MTEFLLRARRPASLVAFNAVLPSNFKIIHKPESTWLPTPGAHIDEIKGLVLVDAVYDGDGNVTTPPVISTDRHYNLLVTPKWSGYAGLFITDPEDPDYDDATLNKSKLKRWFKNNGGERLDTAGEHPRSGRSDMRWFRWTDGTEWLDITIDLPAKRRRLWAL